MKRKTSTGIHYWRNDTVWGAEVLGENPVSVSICPPQISLGLNSHRTRVYAVRRQLLTA